MSASAATANGTTSEPKPRDPVSHRKAGRSIDDIIEQPLQSADVAVGQYPAKFAGFGPSTIFLPSKFRKTKAGTDALVEKMTALFAVRVGEQVRILQTLVSPPSSTGLSSMSTLHKFLKALGAGDGALWDGSIDNVKRGAKLSSFTGKTVMVMVDKDKKGFARVASLAIAPEGVPISFPTEEESSVALEQFQHSGEAEAIPEDSEGIPF